MQSIVVDFDGTITHPIKFARGRFGRVNSQIAGALRRLWKDGWVIIVWTGRSWGEHENIVRFLKCQEVPFSQVVCCKPIGDCYFDKKNLNEQELQEVSLGKRVIREEKIE